MKEHHLTIQEIAIDTEISNGSAPPILTYGLSMYRAAAKSVSKLILHEQQKLCNDIMQNILESVKDDLDILKTEIIGDESWVIWPRTPRLIT